MLGPGGQGCSMAGLSSARLEVMGQKHAGTVRNRHSPMQSTQPPGTASCWPCMMREAGLCCLALQDVGTWSRPARVQDA